MATAIPDEDSGNPRTKAHGAKMLFWYVRLFFAMGLCAGATATLWYQFINKAYPLQVSLYGAGINRPYNEHAVIWAVSALIILVPALYVFNAILRKAIARDEVDLERGVRQWVTYLFLGLIMAIMLGDMVTAVRYFLQGEFTTRFFLKVLTLLVIMGWLFAYVWWELRSKDALLASKLPRVVGITSAVVMVISVVGGFTLVDSPALARRKSFDRQREYDIAMLQFGVRNFYSRRQRMPESLEELREAGHVVRDQMEDPVTGEPYEYRIVNELEFELCATFVTDTREDDDETSYGYHPTDAYGASYLHDAERTCFTQRALDPSGDY